jgi:drug/metabolite transporter (DMT)-like permease
MIWAVFAILAGMFFAVQSEANKHFKVDGFVLNTVQSFISVLLLLPFVGVMEWPSSPTYYLIVIVCAASGVISMMALYNLAAKQNGRVACLYQPIAVLLTFCVWLFIDKAQFSFLMANPLNFATIIGGFVLFGISIQFIRRNDNGWQALLAVIPIAILFSAGMILTKLFLDQGNSPFLISLNFVFLVSAAMGVLSLPLMVSNHIKSPNIITKHVLLAGLVVAIFHTIAWVLFNVGLILSPNPAYVSMMDGLIPVWFMLYYRWRGIPDDASPKAGLLIALAAIIILFAVSY